MDALIARLAVVSMVVLALGSCGKAEVARYETRGAVRADEGAGEDRRIAIHHESIASFRDREGKVAPMSSMPMLFALAPALASVRLQPGDKLRFAFEMHWESSPPLVITRLDRLAPDTPLALSDEH